MSLSLVSILRSSARDRQAKAVHGLTHGTLTVTMIRHTEHEIRAAVRNGAGRVYGVTLKEQDVFCSCFDALYRGAICKHVTAVAVQCLQPTAPLEPIHLMWPDSGAILCGAVLTPSTRFWQRWTLNALNWSDLICQPCVHTWTHPQAKAAA